MSTFQTLAEAQAQIELLQQENASLKRKLEQQTQTINDDDEEVQEPPKKKRKTNNSAPDNDNIINDREIKMLKKSVGATFREKIKVFTKPFGVVKRINCKASISQASLEHMMKELDATAEQQKKSAKTLRYNLTEEQFSKLIGNTAVGHEFRYGAASKVIFPVSFVYSKTNKEVAVKATFSITK